MHNEKFKPTDDMRECARFVRQVEKCAECLHYANCKAHGAPTPRLAAVVHQWLNYAIPRVNARLLAIVPRDVDLSIYPRTYGDEEEQDGGAILATTLRVRMDTRQKRMHVAIYADTTYEEYENECLKAYIKAYAIMKGK